MCEEDEAAYDRRFKISIEPELEAAASGKEQPASASISKSPDGEMN